MNKVILMGRLTKDPDIRYTQGEKPVCIAQYTLAVDRKYKREGDQNADFVTCKAFGKAGEFCEKFLSKGMKICISGRIQTGSYQHKEGYTVYTTDVIVEEQEFCEKKEVNDQIGDSAGTGATDDGFVSADEFETDGLPFD